MPDDDRMLHAFERMNKVLALVAVRDLERNDAVMTLTRAGYTQAEIGTLLDLKLSTVAMIVVRQKAKKAAPRGDGK